MFKNWQWSSRGGWWMLDINFGAVIITWVWDTQWWDWFSLMRRKDYWVFVIGPFGICHWNKPKPWR